MDYNKYFIDYSHSINNLLLSIDTELIIKTVKLISKVKELDKKIYIVGNGGSSSIASHVSVDFVKAAKIKSSTFNNSNLITCFANDYGYENWVSEAIKSNCYKGDLIILISSSGTSKNIINAAKYCQKSNLDLITFSGFNIGNPLNKLGSVNFHIMSDNYNHIEMSHNIILVSIVDIFANKLA